MAEDKKRPGRKPKYCRAIVLKICDEIAAGATNKEAAELGGISEGIFYDWINRKPEFKESVKKAHEAHDKNAVAQVKASLFKRAIGYKIQETKTEFAGTKDGQIYVKHQVTVDKEIAPDVAAAVFWLCNRDPANWKNKQNTSIDGSIGVQGDAPVIMFGSGASEVDDEPEDEY